MANMCRWFEILLFCFNIRLVTIANFNVPNRVNWKIDCNGVSMANEMQWSANALNHVDAYVVWVYAAVALLKREYSKVFQKITNIWLKKETSFRFPFCICDITDGTQLKAQPYCVFCYQLSAVLVSLVRYHFENTTKAWQKNRFIVSLINNWPLIGPESEHIVCEASCTKTYHKTTKYSW